MTCENAEAANETAFRRVERLYKRRHVEPDYSQLIDVGQIECKGIPDHRVECVGCVEFGTGDHSWLDHGNSHRVYEICGQPGLLLIPNPFREEGQWHLIRQSMESYTRSPNISNLHTHWHIPPAGIFNHWLRSTDTSERIQPRSTPQGSGFRASDSSEQAYDVTPLSHAVPLASSQLVRKLRWMTLGLHYDWYLKQYVLDGCLPMPDDLVRLTLSLLQPIRRWIWYYEAAQGAGADMEGDDPDKYKLRRDRAALETSVHCDAAEGGNAELKRGYEKEYRPQAGIVNYYGLKDSLTAHVDRSEVNMEAPLVSYSLGNDCVFLIGGATRDVEPTAIRLRSGDVLVMSGDARRAFHGVPRIIEQSLPTYLRAIPECAAEGEDGVVWQKCHEFIQSTRINVNVRQVFF